MSPARPDVAGLLLSGTDVAADLDDALDIVEARARRGREAGITRSG